MILLIKNVQDTNNPLSPVDAVTFKVVDGEPTLQEVGRLLNIEVSPVLALAYSLETLEGHFYTNPRQCVQGMSFSTEEHRESYYE
ncbi:TPA: hypothetical protein P0E34_004518 [Vibrio campbellii]|nr:hypothetical protein [Vibrio campbellii]HDM8219871.1 hypothetical protein [Vibrio campbellii]